MNINNIKKLLTAYFYENWKKDVIFNFVIIMAIALVTTIMFSFSLVLVDVAVGIMIIYYPCRLFSQLRRPSSRLHYLMIPASNNEKVVTGMFLANVYYALGMYLSMVIGMLLGYGIRHGIFSMLQSTVFSDMYEMPLKEFAESFILPNASIILMVYAGIAVMFFASIYFRSVPFWKTLLTAFIIWTTFLLVWLAAKGLNYVLTVPAEIRHGNYYRAEYYTIVSTPWYLYVFYSVSIVFFNALSFLRMKETEV